MVPTRAFPPRPFLALALLGLVALAGAARAAAPDPWAVLEEVRAATAAAGVLQADFRQTYLPAGFESGEEEGGRMYLELPDCLRWDYAEPYPKSFLLCGGVVHAWNPEDGVGRRYLVEPEEEPGLDLLLLSTGDLRRRYRATATEGSSAVESDARTVDIVLVPVDDTPRLSEARFSVRRDLGRIETIRYRDTEGGTTTFVITGYQPAAGRQVFVPPPDVQWRDQ